MKVKANKVVIYAIIVMDISLSLIYNSCTKSDNDCGEVLNAPSPLIILQIKNNQNKDLLDPATPAHYDTAFIKRSNPWLSITRPGVLPVMLGFNYLNVKENILALSTNDQDTINVSTQTIAQKCYTYAKLTGFKYNNTIFKADSLLSSVTIIYK